MSVTFCIETRSDREDIALASENAPELNWHNAGAFAVMEALGIMPDYYGSIEAAELIERIDRLGHYPGCDYVAERLPRLRSLAHAAQRIGRGVVWG